jgi:hypothetical protein
MNNWTVQQLKAKLLMAPKTIVRGVLRIRCSPTRRGCLISSNEQDTSGRESPERSRFRLAGAIQGLGIAAQVLETVFRFTVGCYL